MAHKAGSAPQTPHTRAYNKSHTRLRSSTCVHDISRDPCTASPKGVPMARPYQPSPHTQPSPRPPSPPPAASLLLSGHGILRAARVGVLAVAVPRHPAGEPDNV